MQIGLDATHLERRMCDGHLESLLKCSHVIVEQDCDFNIPSGMHPAGASP